MMGINKNQNWIPLQWLGYVLHVLMGHDLYGLASLSDARLMVEVDKHEVPVL